MQKIVKFQLFAFIFLCFQVFFCITFINFILPNSDEIRKRQVFKSEHRYEKAAPVHLSNTNHDIVDAHSRSSIDEGKHVRFEEIIHSDPYNVAPLQDSVTILSFCPLQKTSIMSSPQLEDRRTFRTLNPSEPIQRGSQYSTDTSEFEPQYVKDSQALVRNLTAILEDQHRLSTTPETPDPLTRGLRRYCSGSFL